MVLSLRIELELLDLPLSQVELLVAVEEKLGQRGDVAIVAREEGSAALFELVHRCCQRFQLVFDLPEPRGERDVI